MSLYPHRLLYPRGYQSLIYTRACPRTLFVVSMACLTLHLQSARALAVCLSVSFNTHAYAHTRPTLPGKRWFGDNFDLHFLESRRAGLESYIRASMCYPFDVSTIHHHEAIKHASAGRQEVYLNQQADRKCI